MRAVSDEVKALTIPLPGTKAELMAQRKSLGKDKVLNDYIEEAFVAMYGEEGFSAFTDLLNAVWDQEAVEGSCKADDIEAARLMRDYAREQKIRMIPDKNLETISRSLNVVLRRYQMSRKERRGRVGTSQVEMAFKDE